VREDPPGRRIEIEKLRMLEGGETMLGFARTGIATMLLAVGLLVLAGSASAGTLDQKQEDTSNCSSTVSAPQTIAQTFTAGKTGDLDQVDFNVSGIAGDSPQGSVTVQIQGVTTLLSGDVPNGVTLATETVTPVADWNPVALSPTVPVVGGTKYAIVLSTGDLQVSWAGSTVANTYPSGNSADNVLGSGWTPRPAACDQAFRTYVANVTAVTLASASASRTSKAVLLRWRTGTEVDLLGFQVYRSRGGHFWRRVSHSLIAAKGSVDGASYRFVDRPARRGVAYRYRIKAIDRDGAASWFEPVRLT
jgi:hypothetical protein